ncbi:membrane protein [Bordetella ansorpii]|uniref:Membrane protein n=2 Tax=Bordetella ansorpii TaxID=288768 RepID=A0A157NQT7_9BORD|nr:membrane protein [Bordetella ansorpii]
MVRLAATASTVILLWNHAAGLWRHMRARPWWAAAMLMALLSCMSARAMAAEVANPPAAQQQAPAAASGLTPAALADLLENPDTRKTLIDQLRAQVPGGGASTATGNAPAASNAATGNAPSAANATPATPGGTPVAGQPATPGLQDRITDGAQRFLSGVAADMGQGVDDMRALASGQSLRLEAGTASQALLPLALAILVTLIAFAILRMIAMRIYGRIDRWVGELGHEGVAVAEPGHHASLRVLYRRAGAIIGALAIDVAVVLLAAMAGSSAALWTTPGRGTLDALALVFLKAFVAVEIVKVLIRTVFAVRHPHLRLVSLADGPAKYWNGWLVLIAAGAGYGTMLVDPVLAATLSPALGRLAGMIIMLIVYVYAVRGIWQNRQIVRERLENRATSATTFMGSRLRFLSRIWHLLGIAYFTVLLVVSQIDPVNALPFMAHATVQTLLAIGGGSLLILLMNTFLGRPIQLSDDLRRRLPMLEARVNSYVPAGLKIIGWIIRIVVLLLILDAWRAFDLSYWLASDAGATAIRMVVNVVIVLLIAALAWTVIASFIEHRLTQVDGRPMPSARERTLLSLFRNAALIVIVTMTALIILSQIGINIGPLIAGAGVVGLAIGFGAQKLVQDIITGVFIQLENGMNENDVVQVAGVFGTVEKMTIRSVGIRTLDGGYHLVPFSSVDVVANHMRDFSYHLGEYTIAHRESVDDAVEHLRNAFAELMTDPVLSPEVIEDITIPGVTAVNEKGVTIRVLIKTTPGMQWAVQRGYNRLVKKHFEAAGIELPYPHMVVYFGQDKQGYAPPANVAMQSQQPEVVVGETARAAGHTRRALTRDEGEENPADVLGNELEARNDAESSDAKETRSP